MAREKMSREEFDEIKEFVASFVMKLREESSNSDNSNSEEIDALADKIKEYAERIKNSDMSDIPFEAYEGFYDLGFDFTDTGANIDFDLIDRSVITETEQLELVRVKGCNVRNLDISKLSDDDFIYYDEDSFDQEIIEANKQYFWAYETIPDKNVRQKYYDHHFIPFTLEDIQKYKIQFDNPSQPNYIPKDRFMQKVDVRIPGLIQIIPWELILRFNGITFDKTIDEIRNQFRFISRMANGDIEIADEYREIVEAFRKDPTSLTDSQLIFIQQRALSSYISSHLLEGYDEMMEIPWVREVLPESYIIFGDNKELEERYVKGDLTIEDVVENVDLFRGKAFVSKMKEDLYANDGFSISSLTEERIIYLIDNEPEIRQAMYSISPREFIKIAQVIDVSLSAEENHEMVKQYIGKQLLGVAWSRTLMDAVDKFANDEDYIRSLPKYAQKWIEKYGLEKYKGFGLTRTLYHELQQNNRYTALVEVGPEGLLQFDKDNNNFFTKDNYSNFIEMADRFFGNYRVMYCDSQKRTNYTPDDIEEMLIKMMKYLSQPNIEKYFINPEELGEGFQERHKDIVLAKNTPIDLKDKYYSHKLTIDDLVTHSEWREFLAGKDFIYFLNNFSDSVYFHVTPVISNLAQNSEYEEVIDFLNRNKTILERRFYFGSGFFKNYKEAKNLEEFESGIYDALYADITNKASERPLHYSDDYPERFKTQHAELFLDMSIDAALRDKFYDHNMELEDIESHPELIQYLGDKNLLVGFKKNVVKHIPRYESVDSDEKLNKTLNSLIKAVPKYGARYIKAILPYINISDEEIIEDSKIENLIYDGIISGRIDYDENAPDFVKTRNPNIFIDKSAPLELKELFYNHQNSGIKALEDPKNIEYLKGKDLQLFLSKNDILRNLSTVYSFDEIVEFAQKDLEAFMIYGSSEENAQMLLKVLNVYAPQMAKSELSKEIGQDEESVSKLLETDENLKQRYDKLLKNAETLIYKTPGFVLYYPKERIQEFDFDEYYALMEQSKFKISPDYARENAEKWISAMYSCMGYEACKEWIKLPDLSEDMLDELIVRAGEEAKKLYETKYVIAGEMRYILEFFKYLPTFLPIQNLKHNRMQLYRALKQKTSEEFNGRTKDFVEELLKSAGFTVDSSKIESALKAVLGLQTADKMKSVKEFVALNIDETVPSALKYNKHIYKRLINRAIKQSIDNFECLDVAFVKSYLAEAVYAPSEKKDRIYQYSDGVRGYLHELFDVIDRIDQNEELKAIINRPFFDVLKRNSQEITGRWIHKLDKLVGKLIGINTGSDTKLSAEEIKSGLDTKLSVDEINEIEEELYGKGKEHDLQADSVVGLIDNTKEGQKEASRVLLKSDASGIVTLQKAEIMFFGLNIKFSSDFIKFLLANKMEILTDYQIYSKLKDMADSFQDRLEKNRDVEYSFKHGELTATKLLEAMKKIVYKNVTEGYYRWSFLAAQQGLTQEFFDIGKIIIDDMRKREYQTIPPADKTNKKYRGRLLRGDDLKQFHAGHETGCCQVVNNAGRTSMYHSVTEHNGGVFVVEEIDEYGRSQGIVAQSWVWRNGNRVCFDNVEINSNNRNKLSEEGGFSQIYDLYKQAAKQMADIDRAALKKKLDAGKITDEQYRQSVIADVTIGAGNDKLISNFPTEIRNQIPRESIVLPKESHRVYQGDEEILYSDAKSTQYLVYHNNEATYSSRNQIIQADEVENKYFLRRDVERRKGEEIDMDMVLQANRIAEAEEKVESVFHKQPKSLEEILENIGKKDVELAKIIKIDDLSMSMSSANDWHMLTANVSDGIHVLDTYFSKEIKDNTEATQYDKKMALGEFSREFCILLSEASKNDKDFIIDSESEDVQWVIDMLSEKRIITNKGGRIRVVDEDKLKQLDDIIHATTRNLEDLSEKRAIAGIEIDDDENKEEKNDDEITM